MQTKIITSLRYYFLFFYFSFSFAQQWHHLGLTGERIERIAIDKTNLNVIYAGSVSDFSLSKVGKLFKTTNGGISWDTLINDISVRDIDFHPTNSNIVFALGGWNGLTQQKVLKTTDAGKTWVRADSGISLLGTSSPSALEFDIMRPETVYAATSSSLDVGGLYRSTNNGLSWEKVVGPVDFLAGVTVIGIDPQNTDNLFVGTNFNAELFKSIDGGKTWVKKGSNGRIINVIRFSGNQRIYLGAGAPSSNKGGLYYSEDGFETWSHLDLNFNQTAHIRKLVIVGDTLYVRATDKLFRIINSESPIEIAIENDVCAEIAITPTTIYIGTNNGVYKKNIITSVNTNTHDNRLDVLFQNYPNPFNSNTIIKFTIAKMRHFTLKIYNTIGQELLTLVDSPLEPGNHKVELDARMLSSGTYYYRLQAGIFVETKILVLLK